MGLYRYRSSVSKELPVGASTSAYQVEGAAYEDGKIHDDYRIDFLRENIRAMKRAIDKGAEVLAYCPWSAVDLLSTSNGVKKRIWVHLHRPHRR